MDVEAEFVVVPAPPVDGDDDGGGDGQDSGVLVVADDQDSTLHILALPLELILNILAHTGSAEALGRFGCCSRQCRLVCDRGQAVWGMLLASELSCELEQGALRELPPKEALRRWTTQTHWKWCRAQLATQGRDDLDRPIVEPPKRFLQRAAAVSPPVSPSPAPQALVLFGGSSQDPRAHHSTYFNDTWQVELGRGAVRRVEQHGAPSGLARSVSAPSTAEERAQAAGNWVRDGQGYRTRIPSPRTAFSLTAIGDKLYLFGGHTLAHGFTNDLWEATVRFAPATQPGSEPVVEELIWRCLGPPARPEPEDEDEDDDDGEAEPAAEPVPWPHNRQGHSATVMRDGIVLFGGSYPAMALHDTWVFQPEHETFIEVEPAGTPPPKRAGHAAVTVDNRNLLIFGGNTSEATLEPDLWCLDTGSSIDDYAWCEVAVGGTKPSARIGHSAVVLGQTVLIYGGRDLFDQGEEGVDGAEQGEGLCGTIHALNTRTQPMSWSAIEPAGPKPLLRTGHSALPHPSGRGMLVFGGMQPGNEEVLSCDEICLLDVLGVDTAASATAASATTLDATPAPA